MLDFWRAFQPLIPIGVVGGIALIVLAVSWQRLGGKNRRAVALGFLAIWALCALAVTLRPRPALLDEYGNIQSRVVELTPFASMKDELLNAVSWHVAVEQIAGNIILFVPLGVGYALLTAGRSTPWFVGFVAGALAGLTIEALQWILDAGRVSSVDDVLLAATGAGLGFLVAAAVMRRREDSESAEALPPASVHGDR